MYYSDNFLGYYLKESKFHSVNVVIKLINFLLFFLIMIGSKSIELHLFIFVILLLQIVESNVPIKYYFKEFYRIRYVYIVLIFLFAVLNIPLNLSLLYLFKIAMISQYTILMFFTITCNELYCGIFKILNSFNFLNININYILLFITNIILFIPTFVNKYIHVTKCIVNRGFGNKVRIFVKVKFILLSLQNTFRLTIDKMREVNNYQKMNLLLNNKTNIFMKGVCFYSLMLLLFHILFFIGFIMEVKIV